MAIISVESFKQRLVGGGARTNLFKVNITAAPSFTNIQSLVDFEFMCKAASMPGVTVPEIEVSHQGRTIKVFGNRKFENWESTIYNDENHRLRDMFFVWSNRINGFESNISQVTENGSLSSYKGEVTITQVGKDGAALRAYKMVGCWPSVVAPIQSNWDAVSNISEFSVTWAYDYWVPTQAIAPGVGSTISDQEFSLPIVK